MTFTTGTVMHSLQLDDCKKSNKQWVESDLHRLKCNKIHLTDPLGELTALLQVPQLDFRGRVEAGEQGERLHPHNLNFWIRH